MIIECQNPPFQALQGFYNLVWDESGDVLEHFRNLFKIAIQKCFKPDPMNKYYDKRFDKERYKVIRLLDTFMSDSFILNMMKEIVEGSKKDFRVEILLLNPFSRFAELRAKSLTLDAIEEINTTLSKIRCAIYSIEEMYEENKLEKECKQNKQKIKFITEQLEDIRRFEGVYNIKIKFYELLTETPFYLISLFVMKGFILFNSSSKDNPWMTFVDDPSQKNDLYDRLYRNFDQIWEVAQKLPEIQDKAKVSGDPKRVFVSYGNNELVKLKIENFLEKDLGMKPIIFQRDVQNILGIPDSFKNLIDHCLSAIIILTKEDEQKFGETKLYQNVFQNIAYCQAKLGEKKVILLVEEGIELPSIIHGIFCIPFTVEGLKVSVEEIRKKLKQKFVMD